MDASSIITHVSRDDEQLGNYSPEKAHLPRVDNELCVPGQVGKKPGRGVLRSLLCCFSRAGSSKASKGSGGSEGRCSPPHSPGSPRYLLPPIRHQDMHKKCMVIDLDETLVHSSFKVLAWHMCNCHSMLSNDYYHVADGLDLDINRTDEVRCDLNFMDVNNCHWCKSEVSMLGMEPITNADFVVPVEIDGTVHQVYVLKRPYVDEFLQRMGELYECILFTASLAKYADPVADLLDRWGVFRARLFRESCVFHRGNYVKDLNRLGRDLQKVLIVDNSPASYIFHPDNAVPVSSWFDDMTDSEMLDLIPFFERLSKVENVYTVLCNSNHPYNQQSSQLQHTCNISATNHIGS